MYPGNSVFVINLEQSNWINELSEALERVIIKSIQCGKNYLHPVQTETKRGHNTSPLIVPSKLIT